MSVKKQIEKLSRCNIGCNWQLEKCWSSSDRDFRRVYISTDVFSPCISRKRRWLVSLSTPCRLWVQPAARNRKTLCRWNSVELHRAETGQLEQMETCCVLRTTEAFRLKHQELLQGWERDGEGDWRQAVIQDSTKTDRKGDIGTFLRRDSMAKNPSNSLTLRKNNMLEMNWFIRNVVQPYTKANVLIVEDLAVIERSETRQTVLVDNTLCSHEKWMKQLKNEKRRALNHDYFYISTHLTQKAPLWVNSR